MADLDYKSITLNFSELIEKLHQVALQSVEQKNSAIQVDNIAFDDKGKFIGSGEFRILGGMKDSKGEIASKKDFYDVFVEYMTTFAGEENASYIKEDMLIPITVFEDPNKEEDPNKKEENTNKEEDTNKEEESSKSKSTDSSEDNQKQSDNHETVSESFYSKDENKILKLLFEEDSNNNGEATNKGEEDTNKEDESSQGKVIGYSVGYDISIGGKKEYKFLDALKKVGGASKGFFADQLSKLTHDIMNLQVQIGQSKWAVKDVIPDVVQKGVKDHFNKEKLNSKNVVSRIQSKLDEKYKTNDIHVSIMGCNLNDKDKKDIGLISYLNKKGKTPKELTDMIKAQKATQAIVIAVNQRDVNYPSYRTDDIANIVSSVEGMNKVKTATSGKNEKSLGNIIKVTDIENVFKDKSKYDNPNKNSRQVNEKQENQNNKLDELVKSQEYKDFISKTLTEEFNTGVNSTEFKNKENSYEYDFTEKIVTEIQKLGVKDLELLTKIKNSSKQAYCVILKKNLKNFLNEELNIESNLLKLLFENNDTAESILATEENNILEKIISNAIDNINITEDEKQNKEIQEETKEKIRKLIKDKNLEARLEKISKRVIKNTIIRILDNKDFNIRIDYDDLDIKSFSTYITKQNNDSSVVSESLKHSILDIILNEGYDNDFSNNNETVQKLVKLNTKLIGSIALLRKQSTDNSKDKDYSNVIIDPMCAVSQSNRVIEYMKKHNIGTELNYKDIIKNPYCAIVLVKRDGEIDGEKINGSKGNSQLTDTIVQKNFDSIFGSDNKIEMINCTNQNKSTMLDTKGDLISRTLDYYSETDKNDNDKHVPVLDVWVRPFNLDEAHSLFEEESTDNTKDDMDVTITHITVIPDPIYSSKTSDDSKQYQTDWYIILTNQIKNEK